MTIQNPTLVMVDDNPADIELARLMVEELGVPLQFHPCTSGEAALEYLANIKPGQTSSGADYMFLDLNMPGMDGFEVLQRIRGDAKLDQLQVVVLTSSAYQGNIDKAYELGANVVVTKPSSPDDYRAILSDMHEFWTDTDHNQADGENRPPRPAT